MKNFFIYLVSSLFLIFVVESKTGFDVLHNSEFHTTPQNSLKKTSNSDKIFQNGLSKKLDNIGNISLDFDDVSKEESTHMISYYLARREALEEQERANMELIGG